MAIAYDGHGMSISWTYSGGSARRVYGKTLLFLLLVCGLGGAAFACPYPEDIDINPKTVCVGMDSLVSFSTEPGDPHFSVTTVEVTTLPTPSAGAEVSDDGMTVTWNEAGVYSVAITVKITSTDGEIVATKEASVTKTVTVIKVEFNSLSVERGRTMRFPPLVIDGNTCLA